MSLNIGDRVGSYEVFSLLGRGGMGEVYRARDTKLDRDVAIKVLLPAVANDPERLARFRREAQVLASLNNSNIAQIYGLEEADGVTALVLELVEGPTLADRIARGPLPVDEALPIARQIADALEAAHDQGIIHRDLKPANVKVRPDGTVKVLDFGLAKAFAPDSGGTDAALANSPTLSIQATQAGLILGTAAYMSPEQASGKPVDKRSDLWAFGVVLMEMLTGRPVFAGETVSHVLASVLKSEPDWTGLPGDTPLSVRKLLRRCLQKDRHERLESAADARLEIQDAVSSSLGDERPATLNAVSVSKPLWRRAIPVLITTAVGVLATGAVWIVLTPASRPPPLVTRFPVTFGTDRPLDTSSQQRVVISPDGSQLVYVGASQLYRRAMSDVDARPIAGTDFPIVMNPVFSPDGEFVAFVAVEGTGATVKKIARAGGNATTLATLVLPPFGMSWGVGGILVGQDGDGVVRVSPSGGSPERVVSVAAGERAYGPQLLPDGQTILFTLATRLGDEGWDMAQIVVQSLKTGQRTTVLRGGSDARYLPTGHLVYASRGVVFAVPFDARRKALGGPPVAVVQGVLRSPLTGAAHFSVSTTGSLVYLVGPASGSTPRTDLAWFDRLGEITPLKLPPATYRFPRIAPDGRRVAVQVVDGTESNISVYDLSGASAIRRLTFGGHNQFPVWSGDGERIAFQSDREGDAGVFWQRADGAGPAERLTKPDPGTAHIPSAMSPDGRWLLLRAEKGNRSTLWSLSVTDRKTAPLSEVPSTLPSGAVFSPDGRWIAFVEGDGSARGVYVQPFPATGARYEVARGAQSFYPVWSQHGEIFFISEIGSFGVVRVTTQTAVAFGPVVPLARSRLISTVNVARIYDITPDGKRSIWAIDAEAQSAAPGSTQLQVVLNWNEELSRLVPTK